MTLSRRTLRDLGLLVASLMIVALGLWYVWPSRTNKVRLKLSAGNEIGQRHFLALQFQEACAERGITLDVLPTSGSEEALRQVESGEIDLALIQGGLSNIHEMSVRQISALHVEPLHLLVKPKVAEAIRTSGLSALGGRTINVGTSGSGTQAMALSFLDFLQLESVGEETAEIDSSQFRIVRQSYDQLISAQLVDELPDAVFSISSLPSNLASQLVKRYGFELVELPMSDAFALTALGAWNQKQNELHPSAKHFDPRRVYAAEIPPFTYGVRQSQPPQALPTIGTRLLLVGHSSIRNDDVERLLEVLFECTLTKDARPPIDNSVLSLSPEFPWHTGALAYIAHHKPLIAGDFMELTANSLAVLGSMLGGLFFLSQWYLARRQSQREREFRRYLDQVLEMEGTLLKIDMSANIDLKALAELGQRLADLKGEVARRFFVGELEGESLMLGFMNLTNDVRNHILRLVLHERDNVEEQANREKISVEQLWDKRVDTPGA